MSNPSFGVGGYGSGKFGNAPLETLPIGYYIDLLTHEYRTQSPKLQALLRVLLKKFDDVSQCQVQIDVAFDLDYAVGVQLDTLGTILGVTRQLPFQPSNSLSPILPDNIFRQYLQARVSWNTWNGKIGTVPIIWNAMGFTGTLVLADEQSMAANITCPGLTSSLMLDMLCGFQTGWVPGTPQPSGLNMNYGLIIPRPQGVEYFYNVSSLPVFGLDHQDAYVAGFDSGLWSN